MKRHSVADATAMKCSLKRRSGALYALPRMRRRTRTASRNGRRPLRNCGFDQSATSSCLYIPWRASDETPPQFTWIAQERQLRSNGALGEMAILDGQDVSCASDAAKPGAVSEMQDVRYFSRRPPAGVHRSGDTNVRRFDQVNKIATARGSSLSVGKASLSMVWNCGSIATYWNVVPKWVGGRGTGKSTIIESVGAAVGMSPTGEDAKQAPGTFGPDISS